MITVEECQLLPTTAGLPFLVPLLVLSPHYGRYLEGRLAGHPFVSEPASFVLAVTPDGRLAGFPCLAPGIQSAWITDGKVTHWNGLDIYGAGLAAGAAWFNGGIDSGEWEQPKNPYEPGSVEADEWERGLHHGFGDLEDAYYS